MIEKLHKELFFTIVIPARCKNNYLIESIENCINLSCSNFEILVFPDKYFEYKNDKVKIIPTGDIGPAEKRDLSIKHARGEILAFLDDDAYPEKNWLNNSIDHFNNRDISAVCGPAITPESDNLIQKLSGEIYSSFIACGNTTFRYKQANKIFEVDDFPSVNFLIRKNDFETIGGFNSNFWPGEDTKLCLDLINLGKEIIYDPSILVFHHRRNSFKKHLAQVFNYAFHRGYFIKIYPKNSLKLGYFIPPLFLLFIVIGFVFLVINMYFRYFYFFILILYIFLLVINSLIKFIGNKNFKLSVLLIPGIFLTHICYGTGFIKGLLSREIKR